MLRYLLSTFLTIHFGTYRNISDSKLYILATNIDGSFKHKTNNAFTSHNNTIFSFNYNKTFVPNIFLARYFPIYIIWLSKMFWQHFYQWKYKWYTKFVFKYRSQIICYLLLMLVILINVVSRFVCNITFETASI